MSKLLIFLTTFILSINCTCKSGHFTSSEPCDTKATHLICREYSSAVIQEDEWQYFYLPLDGIYGWIYLYMQADGSFPDLYVIFQSAENYKLPNNTAYNVSFISPKNDGSEAAFSFWPKIQKGRVLVGLHNRYNEKDTNVKITYYNPQGNCSWEKGGGIDVFHILDILMAVLFASIVLCLVLRCVCFVCEGSECQRFLKNPFRTFRRQNRENTVRRQYRENPESPPSERIQIRDQDNTQASDLLPFFLKYFPKRRFGELENSFKEIGCSVCLEEFLPETVCHQLYCQHIFHGQCIQKWLEEHHNCPACRVPMRKRAVDEFLEARRNEGNISHAGEKSP